jgi:hypothetical protein
LLFKQNLNNSCFHTLLQFTTIFGCFNYFKKCDFFYNEYIMYFSDKKRKSNKNRWKRQTYVFVYNSIKYFLTYNLKYFQFFKPVKSWFQVKVLLRRKYRKSNSNFIISNIFELSLENGKEDNRIFFTNKLQMTSKSCDEFWLVWRLNWCHLSNV